MFVKLDFRSHSGSELSLDSESKFKLSVAIVQSFTQVGYLHRLSESWILLNMSILSSVKFIAVTLFKCNLTQLSPYKQTRLWRLHHDLKNALYVPWFTSDGPLNSELSHFFPFFIFFHLIRLNAQKPTQRQTCTWHANSNLTQLSPSTPQLRMEVQSSLIILQEG